MDDELWCFWCGEPIDPMAESMVTEEWGSSDEFLHYFCNEACCSAARYAAEREALTERWED